MANLSIALIGLNRISTSLGLALRRYMHKGGKHQFKIVGHDPIPENEKAAKKMGAVDSTEKRLAAAVMDKDIVILAVSYEELEETYRYIADDLRPGAVVLDTAILKAPSLKWAKEYLHDEQHMIGMTPIINPIYLFNAKDHIDEAVEDLFEDSAILLTPSPSSPKAAVDLAFNFAQIVGSKPRFLDPYEHDTMLSETDQLPRLLGAALFYHLSNQENWNDLRWFTNAPFGTVTRPLFDTHPDALRDEFTNNSDVLARSLTAYIDTLTQFRDVLAQGDKRAIESSVVDAAESYETWINSRYRADWDAAAEAPTPKTNTFMQSLLGSTIADKIAGDDKDK